MIVWTAALTAPAFTHSDSGCAFSHAAAASAAAEAARTLALAGVCAAFAVCTKEQAAPFALVATLVAMKRAPQLSPNAGWRAALQPTPPSPLRPPASPTPRPSSTPPTHSTRRSAHDRHPSRRTRHVQQRRRVRL